MRMTGRSGRIIAITGPMFSGKTSRLIEFLEREELAGRSVVLFKPEIDNRYGEDSVSTHKGMKLPARRVNISMEGIKQIEDSGKGFEAIGIDEAEFWSDGAALAKVLDRLADSGKTVYVSLLNRSHRGEPFGNASEILARTDTVHSLTAICVRCGGEATFTQRVRNGKEVFGELIQIGGKDSYEPRCRNCFVRPE